MACTSLVPTARIVARINPFTSERIEYHVGAGRPLSSVVRDIELHGSQGAWHAASVGGNPVPCDMWQSTILSAGDTVAIRAVPAGGGGEEGGKSTGALIGILALTVLTAGFGGAVAGALGIAGKVGTPLVQALMAYGGTAAINHFIVQAPDQAKLEAEELPTLNLENLATPYAAVPRLYGEHLIYPRLGANPYVDRGWIKAIYVLGYGRLDIDESTLMLGDTRLADILVDHEDAEYEIREGYDGDAARTIVPPVQSNQTGGPVLDWDSWSSVIHTADATDEISIDWYFKDGLRVGLSDGTTYRISIRAYIQVRCDLSDGWVTIVDGEEVSSSSPGPFTKTFSKKLTGKVAAAGGGTVDTAQRWEVNVKKEWMEAEYGHPWHYYSDLRAHVQWARLGSIAWIDPIQMYERDGVRVATIGLYVPTDYAYTINRLSVVAKSYLSEYDGEWKAPSIDAGVYDNPAWVYADFLRGTANVRDVDDALIDHTALAAWAAECTSQGFSFSGIYENKDTLFRALQSAASLGRASFWMNDGQYSILMDKSKSGQAPVAFITPRNSSNFSSSKILSEPIHALRCTYVSAANNYIETERIVYRDGYDAETATNIESINMWGCTSDDLADKMAWYYLNCLIHRPEVFTISMGFENLVFQRGDLVELSHDVALIGRQVGRVKSHDDNGFTLINFTLDAATEVGTGETGAGYFQAIVRRASDGTKIGPFALNAVSAGDVYTWTPSVVIYLDPIVGYWDWDPGNDLVMIGKSGSVKQDCLVSRIEPKTQEMATVSLVTYSENVYAAGTEASYEPTINSRPNQGATAPITPEILDIVADESVLRRMPGGDLEIGIVLVVDWRPDYDPESGAMVWRPMAEFTQVQYRAVASGFDPGPWLESEPAYGQNWEQQIFVSGPVQGETYDVRIRSVASNGVATPWVNSYDLSAYASGVYVIGMATPPLTPTNLIADQDFMRWRYPNDEEPIDLAGYVIKLHSGTMPAYQRAHQWVHGIVSGTEIPMPQTPPGLHTFYVKAVDVAGNESPNPASYQFYSQGVDLSGLIAVEDDTYGPGNWGLFTWGPNMFIDGDGYWVPTTQGVDYQKAWLPFSAGDVAAEGYTDSRPTLSIEAVIEDAAGWHIDKAPVNTDMTTDEGFIPFCGTQRLTPFYDETMGGTGVALLAYGRICIDSQPQAAGRPRITSIRRRFLYPHLMESGEMATVHPLGIGFINRPAGMSHMHSVDLTLVSGEHDDTVLSIEQFNPTYQIAVRATRAGSGALSGATYRYTVHGYRSHLGPV